MDAHDQSESVPSSAGQPVAETVRLDNSLYSASAIKRTCYALAGLATFDISAEPAIFAVRICPASGQSFDEVGAKFRTSLIDFSLREEIENRTKGARELIWQTAFGETVKRDLP